MTDRNRLIELLNEAEDICDRTLDCDECEYNPSANCRCELKTDHLLANGVIVLPNKACVAAICDALYALADMVAQFGYSTTFRKKEAVCDGGLSALENAFSALEYCGCRLNSNGTINLKNLFEFQEKMEKEYKENGLYNDIP